MKLQANYNILLPDGKTQIKKGDVFEYEGDISSFKECVSEVKEETKAPVDPEEEAAIREKGRLLGIKSYHNKKLETLKAEIAEIEKEAADKDPADPDADKTPAPAPETTPASTPAQDDPKETKPEGDANV